MSSLKGEEDTKFYISPFYWGVIGSLVAAIVYYLVQSLGMQSLSGPWYFWLVNWYFIAPMIIGFGLQFGIYKAIHKKIKAERGVLAASGGVTTTSMIACCMHNLVLLFPILGLSGVAIFLAAYQDYVFSFSLVVVYAGVLYMWYKYKKLT